jgi:hypothetical protein
VFVVTTCNLLINPITNSNWRFSHVTVASIQNSPQNNSNYDYVFVRFTFLLFVTAEIHVTFISPRTNKSRVLNGKLIARPL